MIKELMGRKVHYTESITDQQRQRFARFLAEGEELVLITGYSRMHLHEIFVVALAMPGFIFMAVGLLIGYLQRSHNSSAPLYGILAGLGVACVIGFLKVYWVHRSIHYLLTTRRLIIKKGVLIVNLTSAMYDKITHIDIHQGVIDRFFMHHGTVVINTAGMNKAEITLPFVGYPIEFKNLLERLINRERELLGRQTGPVETLEGEIIE